MLLKGKIINSEDEMKETVTRRYDKKVDVLFINQPSPDGFIYIRDVNRCGRYSWERMK